MCVRVLCTRSSTRLTYARNVVSLRFYLVYICLPFFPFHAAHIFDWVWQISSSSHPSHRITLNVKMEKFKITFTFINRVCGFFEYWNCSRKEILTQTSYIWLLRNEKRSHSVWQWKIITKSTRRIKSCYTQRSVLTDECVCESKMVLEWSLLISCKHVRRQSSFQQLEKRMCTNFMAMTPFPLPLQRILNEC